MKTFLLNSGLTLLQNQSSNPGTKIVLTGFDIGSGIGEVVDRNSNAVIGSLLYSGTVENMSVTQLHDSEVLLRCEINKAVLMDRPGNILIKGTGSVPFLLAISEHSMFKFSTTMTSVGTKLVFSILINIPGLADRFDFSNLSSKHASFKNFATEDDVTRWAWEENTNQIFVNQDSRTEKPAFGVIVGRNYWGNPLTQPYDQVIETWSTKYPWLKVSPAGKLPSRQAHWEQTKFWSGWGKYPTPADVSSYLSAVDGSLNSNDASYMVNNQNVGSIIIQAIYSVKPSRAILWQLDLNTDDDAITLYVNNSNNTICMAVTLNGSTHSDQVLGPVVPDVAFQVGLSWTDGYVTGVMNGAAALVTPLIAPFPNFVTEREGFNADDTFSRWGSGKISYTKFDVALSDDLLRRSTVF